MKEERKNEGVTEGKRWGERRVWRGMLRMRRTEWQTEGSKNWMKERS